MGFDIPFESWIQIYQSHLPQTAMYAKNNNNFSFLRVVFCLAINRNAEMHLLPAVFQMSIEQSQVKWSEVNLSSYCIKPVIPAILRHPGCRIDVPATFPRILERVLNIIKSWPVPKKKKGKFNDYRHVWFTEYCISYLASGLHRDSFFSSEKPLLNCFSSETYKVWYFFKVKRTSPILVYTKRGK